MSPGKEDNYSISSFLTEAVKGRGEREAEGEMFTSKMGDGKGKGKTKYEVF